MRRCLALLLLLALAGLPAYAQHRGGGGFSGGGFRGVTSTPGAKSFTPSYGAGFSPAYGRSFGGHGPVFAQGTGAFVRHGGGPRVFRSYQPQIAYGGYAAYPVVAYYSYPSPYYNYTEMYPAGDYAAPPVMAYGGDRELNDQVYGLAQQVRELRETTEQLRAQLRAQQSAGGPVAIPAQHQPPADEVATVLVYRDGRRAEIHNYAIVGQTLWVLNGERAVKVSISDLDLERTVNTNQGRGVGFPLGLASKR